MQETLSNFSKYKLITIINIVLTLFLSYFIYNNIFLNTKVSSYIHFLNFDSEYAYPAQVNISDDQFINIGSAKDDLQEKLHSYSNFKSWLDFNNLDEDDLDYTQFLNLKISQGKIIVSEKNTNSTTIVKPINLISDYIIFSINYLNYIYSIKTQKLIDYNIDKYICENVQDFLELKTVKLKTVKVDKLNGNNSSMDEAFSKSLQKLIECNENRLDTSKFSFVESLSIDFENSYKQEFIDLNYYKFISISDIKIETKSLNNLSIMNIYTTSIILLIISLFFQNIIMIYLERNK